MLFIESQDIKPGMRLAKPVFNRNGVLLFDRNTKLTIQNIVNLNNFGLIGIFILEPAEPLPPISKEELEFEQLQTFYMFRLRDNLVNISKGKMPTDLAALAKDVVQHFGTLDHKVHFTQNIRSNTDFVYKHSVGVSIIAAMIGHAMGLRESTMLSVVTAAFLYDFGYLYVPAEIMKKGEDITDLESSTISKYREKAFALLHADTNPYSLPPDSLAMVTQMIRAGKSEDGSIDRSKWLTGTNILTVADKFDRMTAMSLSRKPNSEITAIRYLIDHPESYSENVVSALANCIHIMPVGCCVDLTNGDKGLVLEENLKDFNHPVVLSFSKNEIFDLSDPKVRSRIQIADVMHTMDNRVKMDDETLKQFSSDENSSKMVRKYEFKKLRIAERMKKDA
ncbi:MAG: phosphohydrolase [Eubacterium sp.]|nr:phosphohydrolase [Eubacterium sp.]MCI8918797.1 phosphohydrolase [Eubacterium sp.]